METNGENENPVIICEFARLDWRRDVILPRVYESLVSGGIAFAVLGLLAMTIRPLATAIPVLTGLSAGSIGYCIRFWDQKRTRLFELHKRSVSIYPAHIDVMLNGIVVQTINHGSPVYVSKRAERLFGFAAKKSSSTRRKMKKPSSTSTPQFRISTSSCHF